MEKVTHLEIREKFLKFFKDRGHKIVPSSSLLSTDPSVLFTTAGVQQFKPYYTGELDPEKTIHPGLNEPIGKNAVSIQKCIRTSDIDGVGDESHLTFFEMLGNFSFGGYWKKEAIEYAHEFITKEMGLKIDYVTIFGGADIQKIFEFKKIKAEAIPPDNDSKNIWKKIDPNIRVEKRGIEANFWGPTGDEGPCGPTTEIYVDGIEIWNIVFNEYFCTKDLKFELLKKRGVDTGMGLERLAMAVQKKNNIFETDIFKPLVNLIKEKILNPLNGEESYRIIADHLRASTLLISEGLRPGKNYKEYTLRRLIRRAIMHATLTPRNMNDLVHMEKYLTSKQSNESAFTQMSMDFYDHIEKIYPELKNNKETTETILYGETKIFGLKIREGEEKYFRFGKKISGKDAFLLHQSYGFQIELLRELAKRDGKEIDENGFKEEALKHKVKSSEGAEKKFGGHGLILDTGELKAGNEEELVKVMCLHTATHLLHASLRKILGDEVHQAGSDITAERLRFDFIFQRKMSPEEIKKVEDLVNEVVAQNLLVTMQEMPYEEAIKKGALAFFKLKYPPMVKVYTVGPDNAPFSRELCGGPHVTNTGEIGKFKILKEEAVSSGIRRIRATIY